MHTYNPSVSYAASSTKAHLRKSAQTYNPSVSYAASSPYTGEPIEVRTDPIQRHKSKPPLCKGRGTTLVVEGLFKKWYNPRRSGYYPPTMVVNLRKQMHTNNPSVSYAASSTKARLRKSAQTYNPSVSYAASSPYTGEPNEVCANPIQRHRLTPPLCKGRGTARGGGGVVKMRHYNLNAPMGVYTNTAIA